MKNTSHNQTSTTTLLSTSRSGSNSSRSSHHRRSNKRPLIVLHSLSFCFALPSFLLFVAAIPEWNANFFHSTGSIQGDWADGMPLIPLSFCLVFSIYNFLVLYALPKIKGQSALKSHRNVLRLPHGYSLTLSTMILLSLMPLLIIAGLGAMFRLWRPGVPTTANSSQVDNEITSGSGGQAMGNPISPISDTKGKEIVCNLLNIFAKDCQPIIYKLGELQIGAIVCGGLTWLVWFGLWVSYCRMWQRKRERTKRREERRHKELLNEKTGISGTSHRSKSHSRSGRERREVERSQRKREHHQYPAPTVQRTKTVDDDLATLVPKPLNTTSHLVRTLSSTRKNYYIPNLTSRSQANTSNLPSVPEQAHAPASYTRFPTNRISARLSRMKDEVQTRLPRGSSLNQGGSMGAGYTRFDREDERAQHQPQRGQTDALHAEVRKNIRPAFTISQWLSDGKKRSSNARITRWGDMLV